jgi:hypothetical protein
VSPGAHHGEVGGYALIHTFSERAEAILDAAGARWFQLDATTPIARWSDTIVRAAAFAHTTHRPILMLVKRMDG